MQKITHEEFLNFIFAQPRERKIIMSENVVLDDSACGCMMIHFARNKGLTGGICAGFISISRLEEEESEFVFTKEIKEYFPYEKNGFCISLTYGDVQDYLIEKGEENPLLAEKS